jgi:hypothetical protein
MDMNERHSTLFHMSDSLGFANHLFAFCRLTVALVSHQGARPKISEV